MKSACILLLCLFCCSACDKEMTPQEQAKKIKECEENGLSVTPEYLFRPDNGVRAIHCTPKKEPEIKK